VELRALPRQAVDEDLPDGHRDIERFELLRGEIPVAVDDLPPSDLSVELSPRTEPDLFRRHGKQVTDIQERIRVLPSRGDRPPARGHVPSRGSRSTHDPRAQPWPPLQPHAECTSNPPCQRRTGRRRRRPSLHGGRCLPGGSHSPPRESPLPAAPNLPTYIPEVIHAMGRILTSSTRRTHLPARVAISPGVRGRRLRACPCYPLPAREAVHRREGQAGAER
jgi:hypothetical protein